MPLPKHIDSLLDSHLLQRGATAHSHAPALCFGVTEIDDTASLNLGAIHAWALQNEFTDKCSHSWNNPLTLIATILGKNFHAFIPQRFLIAWVGRKTWPTPHTIQTTFGAHTLAELKQLYLQPYGKDDRLWTATQLLRYPQALAVVVDGSGFNTNAIRRLARTARLGGAALFLLGPTWELAKLSGVQTKWNVTPDAISTDLLSWRLELLKAPALIQPQTWTLAWEQNENATKNTLTLLSNPASERSSRETAASTATAQPLGISLLTDSSNRLALQGRSKKRA